MAGRTEVDLRDVFDGLRRIGARADNLRPVFRELGKALRADIRDHFRRGEGTAGTWPPRAQASVRRILRGGLKRRGGVKMAAQRRLVNQLGRLRTALAFLVAATLVEARSIVRWAWVHQHGGPAGRGVSIPQREFLWVADPVVDRFMQRLLAYLVEVW
jgi:phage gpG-like protein